MAEPVIARLGKDERGRALVIWQDGRTPRMKRYAEASTALAIIERLAENGQTWRGWSE